MYIARRLVRMAVEDIGLAAPEALNLTLSARDAIDFLGSPEGDLALAQAAVYLALAPKSNALYTAYGEVTAEIEAHRAEPVPLHLRNAPTPLMEQFGYGEGYQYAHDVGGWRSRYGMHARQSTRPPVLPSPSPGPGKTAGPANGRNPQHSRRQASRQKTRIMRDGKEYSRIALSRALSLRTVTRLLGRSLAFRVGRGFIPGANAT